MNYKELSNTFKKINKWYGKKTKVLSIKTRPFNTVEIFSNIINKVVGRESNILYVFCSKKEKYAYEQQNELYEYINETIEKEKIDKISDKKNTINSILNKLRKFKVTPIALKDVVHDIMQG